MDYHVALRLKENQKELSDFTVKPWGFWVFLVKNFLVKRNYAKIIPNLFDSLEK